MREPPSVRYETDGPVAVVTMDRPEVANAQDRAMIEELDAAFTRAGADPAIRVVILTGAGRHFSSGHDLKELLAGEERLGLLSESPGHAARALDEQRPVPGETPAHTGGGQKPTQEGGHQEVGDQSRASCALNSRSVYHACGGAC